MMKVDMLMDYLAAVYHAFVRRLKNILSFSRELMPRGSVEEKTIVCGNAIIFIRIVLPGKI
jgi:hypothetical protein